MGNVVSLSRAREDRDAQRAFGRWPDRLGYRPLPGVRLADLPDSILDRLARLDETDSAALYDLVLGVRGWGPGEKFHYLEPEAKMEALDAYLFLADQIRFELMRRLGWVQGLAAEQYSLMDLSLNHKQIMASFRPSIPQITEACPGFTGLKPKIDMEPAAAVSSLIPRALDAFREKLKQQ